MVAKLFRRTEIKKLAEDELYEAQKALLLAESQLEYSQNAVTTGKQRVARLKAFIASEQPAQPNLSTYFISSPPTEVGNLPERPAKGGKSEA